VIVQHLSEIGKKAEAIKGLQKLFLLHLRGKIDFTRGAITNIALAAPSKGMQLVMLNERSAQASSFSDVVRKGLVTDIRCREMTLKNISKVTAGHYFILGIHRQYYRCSV